jgi:hypothetical protein
MNATHPNEGEQSLVLFVMIAKAHLVDVQENMRQGVKRDKRAEIACHLMQQGQHPFHLIHSFQLHRCLSP